MCTARRVLDTMLRKVVADKLSHHLRYRQIQLRAQALQGRLLVRVNEQR